MRRRLLIVGLLLGLVVSGTTTAHAETDSTPPVLATFGFTPKTVDVSTGAQQVTITARVTDATGTSAPVAVINSDDTDHSAGFGSMNLVSGTPQDGIWRRVVTIPTSAAAGTWTVLIYPLSDTLGNSDSTFHAHPTKLTVTNGPTDTTPPVLATFGFTPKTVDVSTGAQQVTITARVTDATGTSAPVAVINSDDTDHSAGFGSMNLVSGTPQDGIWRRVVTIPTSAAAGTWTVLIYPLSDTLGNSDSTFHAHPTKLAVTHGPAFCEGRPVTVDLSFGQTPTSRDDVILGTPGNDTINAGAGNDVVCGSDGADIIQGGTGDDLINGGNGIDTVSYLSATSPVTVSIGSTASQNTGTTSGRDTLRGFERIWGSSAADRLTGSNGPNQLSGRGGDDTLLGLGDNDALIGGSGVDACHGGDGTDTAATCESTTKVP